MTRISVKSNILSEINKNYVKETIFDRGPVSKPAISEITKLSLPTINKIVDSLCSDGYVRVHSIGDSSGGRRPSLYVVNENSGFICIVFIQGMKISAQICSITGIMLNSETLTLDTFKGKDITKIVIETIERLLDGYDPNNLKIIGIGVPGIVSEDGTVTGTPTIPQLEGINLKKDIEKVFNVAVTVENDVNMSAIAVAESNKRYTNLVYIYIGKGVGMGIVLDGRLYKGASFLAGEVGKMVTEKYEKNKNMLTDEVLNIFYKFFPDGTKFSMERLNRIFTESVEFEAETKRLTQLSTLLLMNTFCFLDPSAVFLDGDLMCEPLLKSIKSGLIDYFGEGYADRTIYQPCADAGILGAKLYCLDMVNKNPILIKHRGELWT